MPDLVDRLQAPESPWTSGEGPDKDVVLSSRIRLARNFKAEPFPNREDRESALRVWKIISDFCSDHPGYQFIDLSRQSALVRRVLVEKHFISPDQAKDDDRYRALMLSDDDGVSVMVNEEDQLRIQVFEPGLNLGAAWQRANALDDGLGAASPYAFDEKLGYLTACPTNIGTGLRASVLVHLPALRLTGGLRLIQDFSQMGLAVRGLFGEGSEAVGDFYQISNQQSLGRTEEDIIRTLEGAARRLITAERQAREDLDKSRGLALEDEIWRNYGICAYARRLSSAEAYKLLSPLRMGAATGTLAPLSLAQVDRAYLLAQPGYLMLKEGQPADEAGRDALRASQLRQQLHLPVDHSTKEA
ncbi:ATP--guanido phosphotransferase [Peptococcus simiae]|uniref:ATP--guanido phosphotransferase n=1 Tax=Peptococcus simiae TaxID=1643805 RepID=A0ABW9GYP9_9FIRM